MIDESTRTKLAQGVATLPHLPRQRTGPKKWWRQRQHVRVVKFDEPACRVFIKSYSTRQCEWGLDGTEYYVLSALRELPTIQCKLRFPEPICVLTAQHALATTLVPGRPMNHLIYWFGLTRYQAHKLIDWCSALGQQLAMLQRAAGQLDLCELKTNITPSEEVQKRAPGNRLLTKAGLDRLAASRAPLLDSVPVTLAHGDFAPQNVLIDGEAFGLVDWGYASKRTAFDDPLHFAASLLISQRRGIGRQTAMSMATIFLQSWLRSAELPFSNDERAQVMQLELCRMCCGEGGSRMLASWPRYVEQLVEIVCSPKI
jgi:hypothetical protein